MNSPVAEAAILACPSCRSRNRVPAARLGAGPKCGRCAAPLFPAAPFDLDGRSLDRHLAADTVPLLVDFWAPWCGPCRMMAPMLEAAAGRLAPRARVAKLDIEAEPALGDRFAVRGIPLLVLFAGGREIARNAGMMDADAIHGWVAARLPAAPGRGTA